MAVLEASPVVGSYSSRTILGQMTEDGSNVFRNVTQIEQPGVTIAWAGEQSVYHSIRLPHLETVRQCE